MNTTRRATTTIALAGLFLFGACGGDDDSTGDDATKGDQGIAQADTGGTGSDPGDGEAAGTGEADEVPAATSDALIPVAVGNQWTYRIDYPDPVGTVTQAQEITSVEPTDDGADVTFATDFHYEDGSNEDFAIDLVYTFHPDGSISMPYNAFSVGDSQFESSGSDSVVWPSYADLASGATSDGSATGHITQPGLGQIEASYEYTAAGHGTENVSVPAGSYPDAAVMDLDLQISAPSTPAGPLDFPVTLRMWFAEGVGMVKQEVGGDFMPGTELELVDTNVGQ